MVREKDKKRVLFDYTKKQKILNKSHGVCASCGRPLDVITMTVDHFIPLSKGGTNETANLVALCEDCNKKKRNFVVEPDGWYFYLDEVFVKKLVTIYDKYCSDRLWFNSRNLMRVDSSVRLTFGDHKGAFFRKADYSDLDDIYKCYSKCYNSLSLPFSRKDVNMKVKNFISFMFERGCLYFMRGKEGRVLSVIPMILVKNSRKYQMLVPNILVVSGGRDTSLLTSTFLVNCAVNKFWWGIDNAAFDMVITCVRGSRSVKGSLETSKYIWHSLDSLNLEKTNIVYDGTEGSVCRWKPIQYEGRYTDFWSVDIAVCKDYNEMSIYSVSQDDLTAEIRKGLRRIQTKPFMNIMRSDEDFEVVKSNIELFESINKY